MTCLWMDGFDSYAASADLYTQQYTGSAGTVSTSGGRFGGGAVGSGTGQTINYNATFPLELWCGFAVFFTSPVNQDNVLFTFSSPTGIEGIVTYNSSTGILKVWRGNASTVLGSVSKTMTLSSWHWIDVHYKYHASAGIFEVWIDNVQQLNVTGANTAFNSGQTSLASVTFGSVGSNAISGLYDDLVINDTAGSINNGRVGDSKIESLKPTSDAGPNNGTCSTGITHYLMVNESQWNSTNYITMTNTSGQEELFGIASLSGTPSVIMAVRPVLIAENTDAGSGNLETVIVSSATEGDGSSVPLTSSWKRYGSIYELDPHTSAAWTYAAVNAAQIGWKVP